MPHTAQEALNPQSAIRNPKSRGVSIIAAIFILTILAFMGVMLVSLIGTGSITAVNDLQATKALYIAEGGIERAIMFLEDGGRCDGVGGISATFSAPTNLGEGTFTVTATEFRQVPATTLTAGGIAAGATTIPVNNVAGYAPRGRITIQSEIIEYASVNAVANQFVGCRRGVDGTADVAHIPPPIMRVIQNQCDIISTGVVGSGAFGSAQRQTAVSVWH